MSDEQRVDLSLIGEVAAQLMEGIEEGIASSLEPGEQPPVVKLAGVVVELEWPPNEANEGFGSTSIRYGCSDPRVWIQKALFAEASDIADRGRREAGA